jgi:hypothetical protein
VLSLVTLEQFADGERGLQSGFSIQLAPGNQKPAEVGVGWDFQQPAIDEAQALPEPVNSRPGLPLRQFAERVVAAFPLPAEDDAVSAVVPFFQRSHASFPPQNRMCGGQRRECNMNPMSSPVFPL